MVKDFFYIAVSPSYGGLYNIKIGISNNPWVRIKSIRRIDFTFNLYKVYKIKDQSKTLQFETHIKKWIKSNCEKRLVGNEYIYGYPEIVENKINEELLKCLISYEVCNE